MMKPERHIWDEDSTHRAVAGKEYDEVWDYAEQLEAENEALGELLSPLVDVELERDKLKAENEALTELVAIILCWKPEWAQTSYFKKLPEKMKSDLVELAKSTKHEGSGGIDDEWLDALLTGEKPEPHSQMFR